MTLFILRGIFNVLWKICLQKKDEVRIREIFHEELKKHGVTKKEFEAFLKIAVTKDDLKAELASLTSKFDSKFSLMYKKLLAGNEKNKNDILSKIDVFLKHNSDPKQEQEVQTAKLDRHQNWIEKADKKLGIGVAN